MIWLNMIIPIIAVLVMLIGFKKWMAWWEYLMILAIPLIGIIITNQVSISSQTFDREFWNAYLVRAEYTEYWSTWIQKTCWETCYHTCRDSKGRTYDCNPYKCHPYDCSYCEEHQPSWIAYDNLGNAHGISQDMYNHLVSLWGNNTKIELNRSINHHGDCGVDGDEYVTTFDGAFGHIQPFTDVRPYENRVKASRSVFNFQKVDTSDIRRYGLFKHQYDFAPYSYNPIMGIVSPVASDRLQKWNALLGSSKKIHMMILVFNDKSIDAAVKQESYWKGGNKNEFILCIGKDSNNKIRWTKVISWTEQYRLKLDVERTTANMDFNLSDISDTMAVHCKQDFVKKSFKDFKYLKIEPTPTAVMICFFITIVLTIGLCIISVIDPFTLEKPAGDL